MSKSEPTLKRASSRTKPLYSVCGWLGALIGVLAICGFFVSCADDEPSLQCEAYCDKFVECACYGNAASCSQGCLGECARKEQDSACMERFIAASCEVLSCW